MPAPTPKVRAKPPASSGFANVWSQRKQVWGLVKGRDKAGLFTAVVVNALVSLVETAIAFLLGYFFNRVLRLGGGKAPDLMHIAVWSLGLLAAAYLTRESLMLLRRYLVQKTISGIERDMTVRLLGHLLMVNLAALARDRVGALHGRISRCVEGYVKFLKISFTDMIPAGLTALFALVGGMYTEWRIGLVMACVVPVSVVITVFQVRSQRGIRMQLLRAKEGLDGASVELLGGIEYIRVANTHRFETARLAAAAELRRQREFKHHMAMGFYDWLKSLNEGLFHVAIIGGTIVLAARGAVELGAVAIFSQLFLNIMRPLREVHRILDETYDSSVQVGILMEMLDEPMDASFSVVTMRPPKLDGSVPLLECTDLAVDYTDSEGRSRRVLDGVTMTILHGQTIGIAGPSGSGKSTWLRAVLRLIHPAAGSVLVGGVPIGVLSREDIGKLIGYVSQTPFVFSGTVKDNIVYGSTDATMEQIHEAARKAYIHEEILEMPQGYDTQLSERGSNLSGGQRQRLALARMFLKNPPILILDEGTSALDNISERQVRDAIRNVRVARTVIMVAHRLTSLNEADQVFVFDRGRVVEQGTYDDLLKQGGVFANLVHSAEAE